MIGFPKAMVVQEICTDQVRRMIVHHAERSIQSSAEGTREYAA